jgi:hypothetical protein
MEEIPLQKYYSFNEAKLKIFTKYIIINRKLNQKLKEKIQKKFFSDTCLSLIDFNIILKI